MHTIKRYHDICVGHRVVGHEGKCRHLHGHNYRIHFSCRAFQAPKQISAPPVVHQTLGNPKGIVLNDLPTPKGSQELDKLGRVIDFSVVKEKLCMWLETNWDHKFLFFENDPLILALLRTASVSPDDALICLESFVAVPFNPTAENIAEYLVEVIAPAQLHNTGVEVFACQVEETAKCSATYLK